MKKILLTLAVLFVAVSAQAQGWAVGGRVGSGLQAVGEYGFENGNYVEARFGMSWLSDTGGLTADFTALYNWNVCTMENWTPSAGDWFFDAGVGVNVGGEAHYAYVGAAGCAKLGIKFHSVPLKLSVDWTPCIGPEMLYGAGFKTIADFNTMGLVNFGISCVYCF